MSKSERNTQTPAQTNKNIDARKILSEGKDPSLEKKKEKSIFPKNLYYLIVLESLQIIHINVNNQNYLVKLNQCQYIFE